MRWLLCVVILIPILLSGCDSKIEHEANADVVMYASKATALEEGLSTLGLTNDHLIGNIQYKGEDYYFYSIHHEAVLGVSKIESTNEGQYIWNTFTAPVRFRGNPPPDYPPSMVRLFSEDIHLLVGQVWDGHVKAVSLNPPVNDSPILYDEKTGYFVTFLKPQSSLSYEIILQ